MAYIRKPHSLFLFFCLFFAAQVLQGTVEASRKHGMLPYQQREGNLEESNKNSRSSMIGSVKPTCTYNECRGCRYKCRAEQVPVEGNDPINSAYHYKCVCHSCC